MTVQTDSALTSDAELLNRVRDGESEAYGELYRRHADAARRFAIVLARDTAEAEDLAAEAFARVLATLRSGRGPQTAFRPYLLTSVRNAFYDRVRRTSRVEPTDTIEEYEQPEPYEDPSIAALERSYAARAFARLPERWRAVLWHTEVEGESPTQIAPLFGLTANAVAVLAYRARERLKQGYLAEHITLTGSPRCHWTGEHLPGYVRANLASRDRTKVEDHLAECAECRRLHRELTDANVNLRVVLAPLLLGGAAPQYLATAAGRSGLAVLWAGLVGAVGAWWHSFLHWPTAVWMAAYKGWWWLTTLPRRLARRYGGPNVAAAAGLMVAAILGIAMFVTAAMMFPALPPAHHTDAADIPVPAPAQTGYAVPATGPAQPEPATTGPLPTLVPITPGAAPPTRSARPPAPATEAVALRPEAGRPGLSAGGVNRLPLVFSRAESGVVTESVEMTARAAANPPLANGEPANAKRAEPKPANGEPANAKQAETKPTGNERQADQPETKPMAAKTKPWEFTLDLPLGIQLAGADAGDGWSCQAAGPQKRQKQGRQAVRCKRSTQSARTTANVPLAIDKSATGYQTITVKLPRLTKTFRIPVAPAGLKVAYAATGRLATAIAGNALLSCLPRPTCLDLDNNALQMRPLLPLPTEPGPPYGLFQAGGPTTPGGQLPELDGLKAASGALVKIPAKARIRWAGLVVASSDGKVPDLVALHGPNSGWYPIRVATAKVSTAKLTFQQGYAEVTRLLQADGGGFWWVAASAAALPTGPKEYAGWSLAVVYDDPAAPVTEAAAYAGPAPLESPARITLTTAPKSKINVGIALWDGDKSLDGDTLTVGGKPIGNIGRGDSASAEALVCATGQTGCVWRTPGVDVAQYTATASGRSVIDLRPGSDPLGLGLIVVSQTVPR